MASGDVSVFSAMLGSTADTTHASAWEVSNNFTPVFLVNVDLGSSRCSHLEIGHYFLSHVSDSDLFGVLVSPEGA